MKFLKWILIFCVVIGFLPHSLLAQDFSGGISKPKEYIQKDAVGYAVYSVHSENRRATVDLTAYGAGRRADLKPEHEHCITCRANILFWPGGVAYVSMGTCDLDWYENPSWGSLDNRTNPPYPHQKYVGNASYTVNGSRLTLTYRNWQEEEFTAFQHGAFKNNCGTIRFDEKHLDILTKGTHASRDRSIDR